MVEHRYGGPWTEIKLEAVEYLKCYTAALSRVPTMPTKYTVARMT
jgi:hypothetical protein